MRGPYFEADWRREQLRTNLWLVPVVGRWSDLWHEDTVAALPPEPTYALVADGLADPYHRALIAKHLPRIRSRSNTHNPRHVALNTFARGLRGFLGWTERDWRRFKSDPQNQAHLWQRQIILGEGSFQLVQPHGRRILWLPVQDTLEQLGHRIQGRMLIIR